MPSQQKKNILQLQKHYVEHQQPINLHSSLTRNCQSGQFWKYFR